MNPNKKVSLILERRREENLRAQDERIHEVYNKIPTMRSLDRNIKELGFTIVKMGLAGRDTIDLEEKLKLLRQEKRRLLLEFGFTKDYMDIKYHHELCKDTGFVGTQLCSCRKQLIIDENYNQSNISDLLNYENFNNFNINLYSDNPYPGYGDITPRENIKLLVNHARRYIDNFDRESKNIYIFGEVGRGKTFLLNSIAKELLDRNYSVLYYTSSKLIKFLNDYNWAFEEQREKHQEEYDYILDSDLLIIDDLGSEIANKNTSANLFDVINNRMISGKPIIFSTNYDEDDLEDIYGSRIFSRIVGNSYVYEIIGEDLRLKNNRG